MFHYFTESDKIDGLRKSIGGEVTDDLLLQNATVPMPTVILPGHSADQPTAEMPACFDISEQETWIELPAITWQEAANYARFGEETIDGAELAEACGLALSTRLEALALACDVLDHPENWKEDIRMWTGKVLSRVYYWNRDNS